MFPLPPYFNFRFSNGPTWIENFPAKDLLDYAYGGAVVNSSAANNGPPSLMGQINDYLISQHFNLSSVAEETQYVFWGGANDIFNELSNLTLTATGVSDELLALAVGLPLLTANQIGKLINAGAINILVMLLPTWSTTPIGIAEFSPGQRNVLTSYTTTINAAIVANVSAIAPPGVNLKFFDITAFINMILENSEDFGLVNLTAPCLTNFEVFIKGEGGEAPIVCDNPEQFLYWDGEHPTATIHAIFASEVMSFLGWGT
jgi:thermolabile hemolysin